MSGPRYQGIDDLIHEIEKTATVISGIDQGDADPYTLIPQLVVYQRNGAKPRATAAKR